MVQIRGSRGKAVSSQVTCGRCCSKHRKRERSSDRCTRGRIPTALRSQRKMTPRETALSRDGPGDRSGPDAGEIIVSFVRCENFFFPSCTAAVSRRKRIGRSCSAVYEARVARPVEDLCMLRHGSHKRLSSTSRRSFLSSLFGEHEHGRGEVYS